MRYSDDECEAVTSSVKNYHFVDDNEEPISFSVLPIQWCEDQRPDTMKHKIFLHGTADSGLQKIYKHVTAWKVDFSCKQPEVSVLSKDNNWIQLSEPRKSFEDTVRTIFITLHCLHYVKKNPETSGKSLWDHLSNVFSSYEVRPSEDDLRDHLPFINSAVKQDRTFANCKFLLTFLENPRKRKAFTEDIGIGLEVKKPIFIVDDDYEESDEEIGGAEGDDYDESDPFDTVCAICDEGGDVLCCEGGCFRSFHATVDAGIVSNCESLGFSKAEVEAMPHFLCLNCQYKQHQCFACGKLGSSDKISGAEVFCCVFENCGHFFHPKCAAELLHPENEAEVKQLEKRIGAGESFTCPAHKCFLCKQGENKEVYRLQFAICRRCPRAYHRKCLPREIAFANSKDRGIVPRAWAGLLPKRILIYCLKHEIEKGLATPTRNHIIFPYEENNKVHSSVMQSGKEKVVKKRRLISEDFCKSISAKTPKQVEKVTFTKEIKITENNNKRFSVQGLDSTKRLSTSCASKKLLKDSVNSVSMKVDKFSTVDASKVSLKEEKLNSVLNKSSEIHQSYKQQQASTSNIEKMKKSSSSTSEPLVDAESKKRIVMIMKHTESSITLKDFTRSYRSRSKHAYSKVVDKAIVQEKVEGSVQAVQTALQKLEEGSNFEDSKDIFEPEILNRITEWKVVDKLHWYARKGDTIVNISCGANDFTCLMKQRLGETGRDCFLKNYDVCQPKAAVFWMLMDPSPQNDFNAEKSDWMSVNRKELPTGTQLIMELNLPFGVKSALVNKYIDKALEFKPKLLILFVPQETERLDEWGLRYELVWEDSEKLSGKSLPSSINMNDKQMKQWNLKPPLLHLWSRGDWAAEHKAIALRKGHIPKNLRDPTLEEENRKEAEILDDPRKEDHDHYIDHDQTRAFSPESEHNYRINQFSHDDDENKEGKEEDDEPFLVRKKIHPRSRSRIKKKKLRRLLEDDPSDDNIEAATDENVGRNVKENSVSFDQANYSKELLEKYRREAAEGSAKGLDSSTQSISSVDETGFGKLGSLTSTRALLESAPEKQLVSSRTDMFDKSRSNTGSGPDFLDFAPGPFRSCSHEQHSSCGWIDDE